MLSRFFSFETLAVFPFIMIVATYVGIIESSFYLYIIYVTSARIEVKINNYYYDDLTNVNYKLPYLILTVYLFTLLVMRLIPRL